MKIINFDYPDIISKNRPMVLYLFSDTHYGNPGFNEVLLKKHISLCKNENAYWIHCGDWCESINPKDKRYDTRTKTNPVLEQYEEIEKIFRPIKDNCIGILTGNHDEEIAKAYGDFVAHLARRLEITDRYLGYMGFINIRMWHTRSVETPQHSFILFLHHGHGAGRKIGSKAINLLDLSTKFLADMYVVGHVHTYFSHVDNLVYLKDNIRNHVKMEDRMRYYVSCPSYFKAYEEDTDPTYVHRAAYQPQPIGCVRIELYRNGDSIEADIRPILE